MRADRISSDADGLIVHPSDAEDIGLPQRPCLGVVRSDPWPRAAFQFIDYFTHSAGPALDGMRQGHGTSQVHVRKSHWIARAGLRTVRSTPKLRFVLSKSAITERQIRPDIRDQCVVAQKGGFTQGNLMLRS